MKKKTARWIFVGFCGVLCIQYAMTLTGLEPYPALFYPKFKYLADNQNVVGVREVRTIVQFSDNKEVFLNYRDLFTDAPISHQNHMLSNGIQPKDISDEENKPFHRIRVGNKLYEFRRTILPPNAKDEREFRDFLKQRILDITGMSDPLEISFSWYSRNFIYTEGLQESSMEPTSVRTIVFGKDNNNG